MRVCRWPWLLAFALAAAGCSRAPAPVVHDLARCALVAERVSHRELVLFGIASAESHQASGMIPAVGEPDDDPHALLRRRARIWFRWPQAAPRVVLLDLAPVMGMSAQAVEVWLNDQSLARLALAPDRHRYAVTLPDAAQRTGRNTLELVFQQVTERQTAYRLKLAARLYARRWPVRTIRC